VRPLPGFGVECQAHCRVLRRAAAGAQVAYRAAGGYGGDPRPGASRLPQEHARRPTRASARRRPAGCGGPCRGRAAHPATAAPRGRAGPCRRGAPPHRPARAVPAAPARGAASPCSMARAWHHHRRADAAEQTARPPQPAPPPGARPRPDGRWAGPRLGVAPAGARFFEDPADGGLGDRLAPWACHQTVSPPWQRPACPPPGRRATRERAATGGRLARPLVGCPRSPPCRAGVRQALCAKPRAGALDVGKPHAHRGRDGFVSRACSGLEQPMGSGHFPR
jgi:hypothetical protein